MFLTLLMALALAPAATPPPAAPDPEQTHRRLVFANTYALGFGVLYPKPSGEVGMFLGSTLRPRRARTWRVALGYQVTASVGFADLAFAESRYNRSLAGILYHRHGLFALGRAGARSRLFYSGGVALVIGDAAPIGVELEGRLGWVFTPRSDARVQGIVGGQLRVGTPFDGPPLPQFAAFIGFMVF